MYCQFTQTLKAQRPCFPLAPYTMTVIFLSNLHQNDLRNEIRAFTISESSQVTQSLLEGEPKNDV